MSYDVFADLGITKEKANDLKRRSVLFKKINSIIDKRKFSQLEVAELLNIPQSNVSYLRNDRVSQFSVEKLIRFLDLLEVEVVFKFKIKKVVGE